MATVNSGFSDAAIEMFGKVKFRARFIKTNGDGDVRLWKEGDKPAAMIYAEVRFTSPVTKIVTVENYGGHKVYEGMFDL